MQLIVCLVGVGLTGVGRAQMVSILHRSGFWGWQVTVGEGVVSAATATTLNSINSTNTRKITPRNVFVFMFAP
jgi:hypothetical protein